MTLRERISAALKDAMRAQEADRLSTLRLINAAIKDTDIALRGEGAEDERERCRYHCDPRPDGQAAPGKRARL